MSRHYAPKTFLRQVRGALLNQCLSLHQIPLDLDRDIIKPAVVDKMYEDLVGLQIEQRTRLEEDFVAITELANPESVATILIEADRRGLDLSPIFAVAKNDYERACFTFVRHRDLFDIVANFREMDRPAAGRWTRLFVGRNLPLNRSASALLHLQQLMRRTYGKEGRGQHCHIDYYLREQPTRHCFFAFPEDHASSDLGYDEAGDLLRQARRPAFEVIFVYRPAEGMLDVLAPGGRRRVDDLAANFGAAILDLPNTPSRILHRAFDLEKIKTPNLQFPTDPQDCVEQVILRSVTLSLPTRQEWRRSVVFTTTPNAPLRAALHSLILQTINLNHATLDDVAVNSARFTFVFASLTRAKPKRVTFTVSSPSGCTLKDGFYENIARKYLHRWGFVVDLTAAAIPA